MSTDSIHSQNCNQMARIFISYKRADKEKVFPLKDKIEAAIGEPCWIDLDGIESDAQFEHVIINAIDTAEVFLFMYSKRHTLIKNLENDWTVKEIRYANTIGKRIVFINLDQSPLEKWFLFNFSGKQQIDATSESAFARLMNDMKGWLGILSPDHSSPLPDSKASFVGVDVNSDLEMGGQRGFEVNADYLLEQMKGKKCCLSAYVQAEDQEEDVVIDKPGFRSPACVYNEDLSIKKNKESKKSVFFVGYERIYPSFEDSPMGWFHLVLWDLSSATPLPMAHISLFIILNRIEWSDGVDWTFSWSLDDKN